MDTSELRSELIAALSKSPILRMLGESDRFAAELRAMLEQSEVCRFRDGRVIIQEGMASDRMYILAHGTVEVSREGKVLCQFTQVGDVFGEVGVITGSARTATVTAVTPVVCLATHVLLSRDLAQEQNLLFTQVMQQALSGILLDRLQKASDDLVETKEKLAASQKQVRILTRKNAELSARAQRLAAVNNEGLRGTRGD